ncbi:hypothetical protein [Singulisphaera sp. PoT]|uniref:NHL domain-containing protein n=1 Tax=Singulisphaera sp. PoT TaxID=3411797 RepID=UPI003BF464B0
MRTTAFAIAAAALILGSSSQAGQIVLVAGGGTGGDGSPADKVQLTSPFGVGFDGEGSMYIVEMLGNRIRKLGPDGKVTTVAGTGKKGDGGDDGPATSAEFNGMHHLVVARNGDVYIADTWNNRIRKLDPRTGRVTAFAGTGKKGFSGDGGPALKAEFGGVYCLALDDANKTLYLADLDNRRIRAIDMASGIVSTVAGTGKKGVPKDGAEATASPLVDPRAVAVDGKGYVYILERSGNALRVVDPQGKIRTVAGTGKKGHDGDGGPALEATFDGPKHLCTDAHSNVLIADTENHRIRVYHAATGKLTNLAGTGKNGASGLGKSPEEADLSQPHGVTFGPDGLIYLSDSSNDRVLKLIP